MKINYQKLTIKDVRDFQDDDTLYIFDFRALGEDLFMDIPEMKKYENLGKWITKDKLHTLNEWEEAEEKRIIVKHGELPRHTVYSRLMDVNLSKEIKKLWVAVPHPDSDLLAMEKNLQVNYSYPLFEKLNDKVFQKDFLKDLSPEFILINKFSELKKILEKDNNFFLKKKHGSGSFTSYDCQKNNFKNLSSNEFVKKYLNKGDFFLERRIKGKPFSFQVLKNNEEYIIFGFTEQLFEKNGFYEGNLIYSIDLIKDKDFIEEVLSRTHEMLKDYDGVFGIDFMKDESGKNWVLELNVRITAVTLPTLISNEREFEKSRYLENVHNPDKKDIILTSFKDEKTFDILREEN